LGLNNTAATYSALPATRIGAGRAEFLRAIAKKFKVQDQTHKCLAASATISPASGFCEDIEHSRSCYFHYNAY